jgi:UDP-GlcNAc:undecaprenyl-phosphate GlcNAc-1-phosphate transferase
LFVLLGLGAVFVLLGVTNAINLADGLDGLAGGTSLLSFSAIAILAYLADNSVVLLSCLAVMGSITGFLRFNTYPAVIFMGDGGSQFLGFSLCVLAIMLTQNELSPLSPALPLFLVGLPILDTLLVMAQRIRAGRSPFAPDMQHIHHRLLRTGFDHYEAVVVIYCLQAALVTSAYFLRFQSDLLIATIYTAFCAAVVLFFYWVNASGWRHERRGRLAQPSSYIATGIRSLSEETGRRWISAVITTAVAVYFIASILFGAGLDSALALSMSVVALALFALVILRRRKPLHFIERTALYLIITIVVYLNETQQPLSPIPDVVSNVFFVGLGTVVIFGIWFCNRQRFRLTPLDFLVMFMAFVVPNLPGSNIHNPIFGIAIAKMCVLFYASEIMFANLVGKGNAIRVGMVATLGSLGAKGLLFG